MKAKIVVFGFAVFASCKGGEFVEENECPVDENGIFFDVRCAPSSGEESESEAEAEAEAVAEGESEAEAEATARECLSHDECDDENPCTTDYCTNIGCQFLDNSRCAPCEEGPDADCDEDEFSPRRGDCDDRNPEAGPDIEESAVVGNLMDGLDNDCDGTPDEWGPGPDADGDAVRDELDCDRWNADRWPGAPEVCDDGVDSNCDGADNWIQGDPNSYCVYPVGTIDGLNLPGAALLRIFISGNVPDGLVRVADWAIIDVAVGTEAEGWQEGSDTYRTAWQGAEQSHELIFPRGPFVPRVRTFGGPIDFDLEEWALTGSLHRIPARNGTGIVLVP